LALRGDWRQVHNEEVHDWSSSPDIISAKESKRVGVVGNVARRGKIRNAYIFSGDLEGKEIGYIGIDG
jgi:hypothetical protein